MRLCLLQEQEAAGGFSASEVADAEGAEGSGPREEELGQEAAAGDAEGQEAEAGAEDQGMAEAEAPQQATVAQEAPTNGNASAASTDDPTQAAAEPPEAPKEGLFVCIRAHKFILSAGSTYFRARFKHAKELSGGQTQDPQTGLPLMHELGLSPGQLGVVQELVWYLYAGKLRPEAASSPDNLMQVRRKLLLRLTYITKRCLQCSASLRSSCIVLSY